MFLTGSKDDCEKSVSLIQKANSGGGASNASQTSSDVSATPGDRGKENENDVQQDHSDDEPPLVINETLLQPSKNSEGTTNASKTTVQAASLSKDQPTTLPRTTTASTNGTVYTHSGLIRSLRFFSVILKDVTNTLLISEKRKEANELPSENTKKKKIAGTVSQVMYEKLKKENLQLMKEIEMYRSSWMSEYLT